MVKTDYSLIDSDGGSTSWSITYNREADWQQHTDQIIENINRRSVRQFPYRINR
ncbi:MAG: hypothetical protein AB8G15_13025 [Saprospiraceae bacterium]